MSLRMMLRIDIIHDARHLCTRFRIDGIKAMSCGISGDKQVLKFANTSDRGLVCLSSLFAKCTVQGLNRPTYDPSYKVRLRRVRL